MPGGSVLTARFQPSCYTSCREYRRRRTHRPVVTVDAEEVVHMALRLADRLNAARQRQFVGRVGERDLLRDVLAGAEMPFCVLYIFGPGGVGKTALLGEYMGICQ